MHSLDRPNGQHSNISFWKLSRRNWYSVRWWKREKTVKRLLTKYVQFEGFVSKTGHTKKPDGLKSFLKAVSTISVYTNQRWRNICAMNNVKAPRLSSLIIPIVASVFFINLIGPPMISSILINMRNRICQMNDVGCTTCPELKPFFESFVHEFVLFYHTVCTMRREYKQISKLRIYGIMWL